MHAASQLHLRSASRHQLIVRRCRLNTCGRRAFSITGPTVWNSLPDGLSSEIRRVVLTLLNSFPRQSCLVCTNVISALEVFSEQNAPYESTLYLLAYLLTDGPDEVFQLVHVTSCRITTALL